MASSSQAARLSDLRRAIQTALADAYAFVQSQAQMGLSKALSIDDYRRLELEQIEGPEDPKAPLIQHTTRQLSSIQRVEQTRQRLLNALEAIRSNPEVISSGSSTV